MPLLRLSCEAQLEHAPARPQMSFRSGCVFYRSGRAEKAERRDSLDQGHRSGRSALFLAFEER